MSRSQKVLIFGGLALAALGMLYGLHYAIFIEHQTLDNMGGSLATAFVNAAERNTAGASGGMAAYAATKYNYVRQVDVHSHWVGLAMLMIVLGAAFPRVGLAENIRFWLATAMLTGSVIFPLGVILQTLNHGGMFPSVLAVAGSALVTISLGAAAWGFARSSNP